MYETLPLTPSELSGRDWHRCWSLSAGGSEYAVAGVVLLGDGVAELCVKVKKLTASAYREFRDNDLPYLKGFLHASGVVRAVSVAGINDVGFVKLTSRFGWTGHQQVAVLEV